MFMGAQSTALLIYIICFLEITVCFNKESSICVVTCVIYPLFVGMVGGIEGERFMHIL